MEEREKVIRKVIRAGDEPDVVGHVKPRETDEGEREKKPRENDEPDVEAHIKTR